jgi:hypothetical protein
LSTKSETISEVTKSISQLTVSELVENLQQKGFSKTDATQAIYTEWKKGSLNLTETNPPINLGRYFFSIENMWFWAITTFTLVTAAFIFTIDSSALLYGRYVLGGVFILFLPGFMLISALYPRSEDLDGLERVALSIGLSLAIVPLVGLALNYTPWGIRLAPIVIAIAAIVEVLAVVCVLRKFKYHLLSLK